MTMGVYQLVQNQLIKATREKQALTSLILRQCRTFLLKIGDQPVETMLEGVTLKLPFSHDLPKYFAQYPLYMKNFTLLGKVVYEKYSDLCAIDIGANVGDTLVFLRKYYTYPIVCIEGNPAYLGFLKENASKFEAVSICPFFVGKEGEIEGKLITEQGTARIDLSQKSDGFTAKSLQQIYSEQPYQSNPKFIKIDTDGFDLMILRESIGFIEKYKPVLFFEFDPFLFGKVEHSDSPDIFELLSKVGYTFGVEFDNIGKLIRHFNVLDEAKSKTIIKKYENSNGSVFSDIALFHSEDEDVYFKYLSEVEIQCR